MLKLFALFHLNLMYSSLNEADGADVIRHCYHPLLDLASDGLPVALEASGITLERIKGLDRAWVARLRDLCAAEKVVFVGSGYSQIIAPLVPAHVNRWNLTLGRTVYEEILAISPRIWLLNEMTYSAGLPRQYVDLGAEAVVMEWNNARRQHSRWSRQLAFHRQVAVGSDVAEIPLIWVDTIDFQQLQRMVHGEAEAPDLLAHWRNRATQCAGTGFASFYGNDAEVFGFRPGRYATERPLVAGEWGRVATAARLLAEEPNFQFVPIDEVLAEPGGPHCGLPLHLESAAMPIVVKKQEKYNLSRWALTGRGDLEANTACFKLAAALEHEEIRDPEPWRRLCRWWSSDLRTHITPGRWDRFMTEITTAGEPLVAFSPEAFRAGDAGVDQSTCEASTTAVQVVADPKRGLTLRQVVFPEISHQPAVGTIGHGFFEDIALGADFYTGHTVVQRPGRAKITDLGACQPGFLKGETSDGRMVLGTTISAGEMVVRKQVILSPRVARLEFRGQLELPERAPGQIHPLHITLWPGFLDPATTAYAVCNGGETPEVFPLGVAAFDHGASYSTLITAKSGLGATDGKVIIGDASRRLVFCHDHKVAALIPMVCYVPVAQGPPLLRLYYSAQENDETFIPRDEPWQVSWIVSLTAENRGLELK